METRNLQRNRLRHKFLALKLAFAAFVFSIPFETVSIGLETEYFSISKVIGFLFLFFALLEPEVSFKEFPWAIRFFFFYFLTYALLGILQTPSHALEYLLHASTLLQMIVMTWIAYNLLRTTDFSRILLAAFGLACVVLTLLQLAGISTSEILEDSGTRFSVLKEDPNNAAGTFSIGVLALFGLAYAKPNAKKSLRVVAWVFFVLIIGEIVKTGSRGAMTSLSVGMLVFLFRQGNIWERGKSFALVMLGIGLLLTFVMESESSMTRWREVERGNFAGREKIQPLAFEMFLEKPLLGWGPVEHYYELGSRFNRLTKDTHNLFLWIATEVGLIGLIPFLVGLWLCGRSAWRARSSILGLTALAMFATVFVINLGLSWHNRKPFWLVLAFALAVESVVPGVNRLRERKPQLFPGYQERA